MLENAFRNLNVALVNELLKIAYYYHINFWELISPTKTKP
mgnify:CR=1 FL=1